MILLDTNVISELMRDIPDQRVVRWIDEQFMDTLHLCTTVVAELRAGVSLLPEGKRRRVLHDRLEQHVLPNFARRTLSFDMSCTTAYAHILAAARNAGIAIQGNDACIAAVAYANGLTVATRDVSTFTAAGQTVINPWEQGRRE